MRSIKQMWTMRLRQRQGLPESTLLPESQSTGLLAHPMLILVLLKGQLGLFFFSVMEDSDKTSPLCTPRCFQIKM